MGSGQARGSAYLAGGGIASLAAAVFLVRDAGFDGTRIRILEELPVAGGALDGSGDPEGRLCHARRPDVRGGGLLLPVELAG